MIYEISSHFWIWSCFLFWFFGFGFVFFLKNEISQRKTLGIPGNAGREPARFPPEYRVMSALNHPPDGARRPSVDAAIRSINARRITFGRSTTNPTPHSRRLDKQARPSRVLVDVNFLG